MNLRRISLYLNTIRYLKPSQIVCRVKKVLKMECSLGVYPRRIAKDFAPQVLDTPEELDFDAVFLARYPLEELMADKITLLHETEVFPSHTPWFYENRTPLWNYNLHYFEYAFPLVKAYQDARDERYLEKLKSMICAWIEQNPRAAGGIGWDAYPVALRLTNWLSIYAHLSREISEDAGFRDAFLRSIWEQYDFLSRHLEKDLLGNHYFEDLKALILCALFFGDDVMFEEAICEFHRQCQEQILPDGMHFELSPMYHKLILEDVMRVAVALRGRGKQDEQIESYLQAMLDVAYSLEEGLDRIPLFNDCGNNVAKNLDALCAAAKAHFKLTPKYKDALPDSGYYLFKQGDWKLIVDAGQPGPDYLPGHVHCDAMSFELFKAGKPVLVNCGTYAYQCDERAFFRSTAAHNTVMVEGVEQSQCWGTFRMSKRAHIRQVITGKNEIIIELQDQCGHVLRREIVLNEGSLLVTDATEAGTLHSFLHLYMDEDADCGDIATEEMIHVQQAEQLQNTRMPYASEFGQQITVHALEMIGNPIQYEIQMQ